MKPAQKRTIHMMNAETNDKPATVGEQGAHVAPEKARSKKRASQKKGAPKKKAKSPRARAQKRATEARSNKKAEIIAMMKRAKGVTLAEIMAATGWLAHTVRGFVSILGSKGGQKIESSKNTAGDRAYRIAK